MLMFKVSYKILLKLPGIILLTVLFCSFSFAAENTSNLQGADFPVTIDELLYINHCGRSFDTDLLYLDLLEK